MRDIKKLLLQEYALSGSITQLGGENENYRIDTETGDRYVFKLADVETDRGLIDLEYQIAERIHGARVGLVVPRIQETKSGERVAKLSTGKGTSLRGRLLDFVPGVSIGEVEEAGDSLLQELGTRLGALTVGLAGFDHPAAHRTNQWDLAAAVQLRPNSPLVKDPLRRRALDWALCYFTAAAEPELAQLPHSVIHADANDENVLVEAGHVHGLVDFGDCLYNPKVCELAIALAYAMLEKDDPLGAGAMLVAG